MKDIVIASAARTPVGSFNGAFATLTAHDLGAIAIEGCAGACRRRAGRGAGGDPRPDSDGGAGAEPGAAGGDEGGHSEGSDRLGIEPALRLRAARRRHRHAADPDRRRRDHRGGRAGIDVRRAARRAPQERREDGRLFDGRHHAEGRADRRLQRLPHGHHGRERRPAMADHAGPAGRIRRRLAEQGGGRAEGRALQGRDRPGHGEEPQGRRRRRHRTNTPATARRSTASPSCARPSTRKARSRRRTRPASTTARRRWC